MSKKIAHRLFEFQYKHGMIDLGKRRLYEYAYSLLICRLTVYALLAVSGALCGNLKEMAVFLLAFIPLRQYAGGLHLGKEERCIALSGILVCIMGEYLKFFPKLNIFLLSIWLGSLCMILRLAPVGCQNKKLDAIEKKIYKKRTWQFLGTECFLFAVAFMSGYIWISKCIICAQIMIALSLLLGVIKDIFFACELAETNLR